MNILLVGSLAPDPRQYTYASSFERAFKQLGHNVTVVNTWRSQHWLPWPARLIKNRYASWHLNKALRITAQSSHFAIIFFIKAHRITAKTIEWLRHNSSAQLIHLYPDNPFVCWNGNSNAEVLQALPLFDCWLSWSRMLMPALISAGCQRVEYFPFAFDADLFNQELIISPQELTAYSCDVSFIGTWEPTREQWLSNLITQAPQLRLKIWGNLWGENLTPSSPLRTCLQGPALYGSAMIKAFRCAAINLNFIRTQNMTAHNMRTFEIPASGGFMLTERTDEQTVPPFHEDENISCFSSQDELLKKILLYIHDAILRKRVATQGWHAVRDYTIVAQLDKLLVVLGK